MSGRVAYFDSGISYLGTEEMEGRVEMGFRDETLRGGDRQKEAEHCDEGVYDAR